MTKFAWSAMAGVAIIVIASGAAAFSGLLPIPGGDAPSADTAQRAASAPADEVVAPLEEIIVDITARTVANEPMRRFLKADLALVYRDAADAERGAASGMHLRDAFVDYLRQLDERDLLGSAGLARLRADLLHRARVIMGPNAPTQVLIADLVVQ